MYLSLFELLEAASTIHRCCSIFAFRNAPKINTGNSPPEVDEKLFFEGNYGANFKHHKLEF
jgi:hypothetical protein